MLTELRIAVSQLLNCMSMLTPNDIPWPCRYQRSKPDCWLAKSSKRPGNQSIKEVGGKNSLDAWPCDEIDVTIEGSGKRSNWITGSR